jgi:hypothetical protein
MRSEITLCQRPTISLILEAPGKLTVLRRPDAGTSPASSHFAFLLSAGMNLGIAINARYIDRILSDQMHGLVIGCGGRINPGDITSTQRA